MRELARLIDLVCSVIARYLGDNCADLYRKFYLDKPERVIFISINELLSEVVGEEKAQEVVEHLRLNYEANGGTK